MREYLEGTFNAKCLKAFSQVLIWEQFIQVESLWRARYEDKPQAVEKGRVWSVLPSETQPAGQGSESTAENSDSQDSPQTYRARISGGGPSNVCFNKPSWRSWSNWRTTGIEGRGVYHLSFGRSVCRAVQGYFHELWNSVVWSQAT